MSKVKNRQKILITNFIIYFSLFFFFISIFIFIIFFRNEIVNSIFQLVQKNSEKYGYTLKYIEIFGVEKIDKDEILLMIDDKIGKSVFLISLKDIKQQLTKHKWVQTLNIKIEYPSKISLKINEKEPIAIYYENNNKYVFVDNNGKIIDIVNDLNKEKLIIASGIGALNNIPDLINALDYNSNLRVTYAEYIGKRRWNLVINEILTIKLPEENFLSAIKKMNKLLIEIKEFDYSLIKFIDLRMPKKAIIRFYDGDSIDLLNDT